MGYFIQDTSSAGGSRTADRHFTTEGARLFIRSCLETAMRRFRGYRSYVTKLLLSAGLAGLSSLALAAETNTVPRQEVQRLIGEMGHAKSARRDSAQQKLTALSADAPQVILDEGINVYASSSDPEVRTRLREVLSDITLHHGLLPSPGYLGIHMLSAQTTGPKGEPRSAIQAMKVDPASPAEKGGIRDGDLILVMDDLDTSKIPSTQEFFWYVRNQKAGETAKLTLKRNNQFTDVEVKLGEVPPEYAGGQETVEANRKKQFDEWLKKRLEEERQKARP
jgi:C-terminal processing protease CtpA/Prc